MKKLVKLFEQYVLGSKPASLQMFQILMQECTMIKNKQTCVALVEKFKTQILDTYLTNTSKTPQARNHPPAFFGFLFMMRYHFILFSSSKNKYWKHIEKYTEKQFRLETTLPVVFLVPIHDLLSLHFILVQAKIGKYRKIPEQQYKQYPKNAVYARNHPPGHLAGGWFSSLFFYIFEMFPKCLSMFLSIAQGMFVLLLWISVQSCSRI